MKPTELREHTFILLFHMPFYGTTQEMEEQISLYLKPSETENAETPAQWWRGDDEDFLTLAPADFATVEARVHAVMEKLPEIDAAVTEKAVDWKINRMSKVDLTILRLAVYELMFDESIPEAVAINEAVELAKKFGGDHSSRFVNGILAKFTDKHAEQA